MFFFLRMLKKIIFTLIVFAKDVCTIFFNLRQILKCDNERLFQSEQRCDYLFEFLYRNCLNSYKSVTKPNKCFSKCIQKMFSTHIQGYIKRFLILEKLRILTFIILRKLQRIYANMQYLKTKIKIVLKI